MMMMRRRAWSLMSARNAGTLIAPPDRAVRSPPAPFGRGSRRRRAQTLRAALAAVRRRLHAFAFGELRTRASVSASGSSAFQCDLMPSASTFTCASVSGPPFACENAGIGVPARPSSNHAQQFLIGNDRHEERVVERRRGPSLPSAPWQPAQLAANSWSKSRI